MWVFGANRGRTCTKFPILGIWFCVSPGRWRCVKEFGAVLGALSDKGRTPPKSTPHIPAGQKSARRLMVRLLSLSPKSAHHIPAFWSNAFALPQVAVCRRGNLVPSLSLCAPNSRFSPRCLGISPGRVPCGREFGVTLADPSDKRRNPLFTTWAFTGFSRQDCVHCHSLPNLCTKFQHFEKRPQDTCSSQKC